MSEGKLPYARTAEILDEDVNRLHKSLEDLYSGAEQRFGGFGEGSLSANFLTKARYVSQEGELVTIDASQGKFSLLGLMGLDPDFSQMSVHIETPMPYTDLWPNTYLVENFSLGVDTRLITEEKFSYEMGVHEYTNDGCFDDRDRDALRKELLPLTHEDGELSGFSELDDKGDTFFLQLGRLELSKLQNLRHVYPEHIGEISRTCRPERFSRIVDMITDLTLADEVGCEPNPYIRT